MKQKIKIMKHRQQASDEEIQGYMNFNRLLDDRKIALNVSRTTTILKWGVPILVVTVGTLGLLWMRNNTQAPVESSKKQSESLAYPQNISPVAPADSAAAEKIKPAEIEVRDEQKKIPQAKDSKPSEKSSAKQEVEPEVKESGYVQAEPLNGYSELYEYFNANLVYPSEALKDSIQGVQTISFVINVQGDAEQIEIVKSLGAPFERECRRLIENMPEWKPATLNGKPVASRISLPLTFQIQKIKN
jgi:TonB family protein